MMKRSGVFLFFIVALCVWAGNAHAVVLETNEWTTLVRPGWAYNAPPVIDTATNTPAGGGALKMTCYPGVYSTSMGCGRGEYNGLSGTELYVGHWIKFSSNFTYNPLSTKIDYMWTAQPSVTNNTYGAFTLREQSNGARLAVDITIQGNGQLGPNSVTPHTVYANFNPPIQRGEWYWLEYHVRMNDVACSGGSVACVTPNGLLEVWLNDNLQMRLTNVRWIDIAGNTWKTFLHSAEWGGGGGTIPDIQYMWYDHTVISTTRIGRPASTPSGDTTAPRSPVLNFAN